MQDSTEKIAKSEMLIVMQNVNPAARGVKGAFCDNCLVGLDHAVLLPWIVLEIFKQRIARVEISMEGSKFACVEKCLQYK